MASGGLAGLADARERGRRVRHGQECRVELVGEPGGQPRCAARARTADENRRARALGRLRQRGRVRQLVVRSLEGEPLAYFGLPQPGYDRELFLEPTEALAE
jgi:hypothetical protein